MGGQRFRQLSGRDPELSVPARLASAAGVFPREDSSPTYRAQMQLPWFRAKSQVGRGDLSVTVVCVGLLDLIF